MLDGRRVLLAIALLCGATTFRVPVGYASSTGSRWLALTDARSALDSGPGGVYAAGGGGFLNWHVVRPLLPETDIEPGTQSAAETIAGWAEEGTLAPMESFPVSYLEQSEAYLEWTVPERVPILKGTSVKAGRFWSVLADAPLQSRSGLSVLEDGVRASWWVSDALSLTCGVVRGTDALNALDVLALEEISYTVNERVQFAAQTAWDGASEGGLRLGDVTATVYPIWPLTLLLNYGSGQDEAVASGPAGSRWQSVTATGQYRLSDRGSITLRAGWVADSGSRRATEDWGTAVGAVYDITPSLVAVLDYRHGGELPWGWSAGGDRVALDVAWWFH